MEDGLIILDMLVNTSNKEVGIQHEKDRTHRWKRRKHLMIEEYRALKESILEVAQ